MPHSRPCLPPPLPPPLHVSPAPPTPQLQLLSDQPWNASKRRQKALDFLHAKLMAEENDVLQREAAHGFWEMAINKDHHADFGVEKIAAIVNKLRHRNMDVSAPPGRGRVGGLAGCCVCVCAHSRGVILLKQ